MAIDTTKTRRLERAARTRVPDATEATQPLVSGSADKPARTLSAKVPRRSIRWYEGEQPTAREMLAQVGRLSEKSPDRAREAYDLYAQAVSDRNSPVWNPYAKATNTGAIEALTALGVDLSGGVTKERIDALKPYADYTGHAGVSGAPLAPTKSSTDAQNLAYWLYQLDKDETTTQKAESEWDSLQQYLSEQVKLGKADDEIIDGIEWNKYGTLTGMDEARRLGVPTQLNRAVGYSEDAIYGALWAARNPEAAAEDAMVNAANYALGRGTMLKKAASKPYAAADDVSNYAMYNPYKATGGTFSEATKDWHLADGKAFTLDDIIAHRSEILSAKDGEKTIADMMTAAENSEKAEGELDSLNKQIARLKERGKQPEEIWAQIEKAFDAGDYPTLAKMEEGRIKGKPLAMAGGVTFTLPALRREVYKDYEQPALEDMWAEQTDGEAPAEQKTITSTDGGAAMTANEAMQRVLAASPAPAEEVEAATEEAKPARGKPGKFKAITADDGEIDQKAYTSALTAEIDKLLEGKSAESPEAKRWYDEYGYLLGGERLDYDARMDSAMFTGANGLNVPGTISTDRLTTTDQRAELGQQAIDALEVDRVGEKGGYIDADTRISHAVALSEDVKAASNAGVSLPEYYQAHPELTEKFDQWRAEADEARSAWQAEIEAEQQRQRDEINAQITDLYDYEQGGGALDYDAAAGLDEDEQLMQLSRVSLHNQIMGQSIDTLMKNDAGYKAERSALSDAILSELKAGDAENDYYIGTGSIASALFDHAGDLLDKDAKFAAAMGMTLEDFYEAHPEARKDAQSLAEQAVEVFNQTWAQGDGEELALELLRAYNEEGDGTIDTPAPEADDGDAPEGELSWAGAAGRGVRTGLRQWVNGKIEPIAVFGRAGAIQFSRSALDSSDEYLAAQARNFSRADYRAAVEQTISDMANEADKQYWTERLTNWDGDIYNIGLDIDYEALRNNIEKRRQAIQADTDFVNKNGSGAERTLFGLTSNVTLNLALMAENTLIGTATGLNALSGSLSAAGEGKNIAARALSKAASAAVSSIPTAYTYGLPEGAEMAQSLESDYGIDPVTAATYGGAQAIVTGMMESLLGIDKIFGRFDSPAMQAIAKAFDEDDLHALGLVGLLKNLAKNGFRDTVSLLGRMSVAAGGSEAFQEGAEYIEGAGLKALSVAVNSDMSFSEAWSKEADAGDLWENMKQGGLMGVLLGMASADVGLMTGQTQIYDMAAHEAGRDAANRLLRADASTMTQEEAARLLDVVAADMKANPTLLEDAAADYQAAMITADKIANGALTGVDAQFEAQIAEAQSALDTAEAAAQETVTALQQAAQQQLDAENALKAAAGDKRRAKLMQAQLKNATAALQTAQQRQDSAQAARDEAAQNLAALNAEKEANQTAAFEELRRGSRALTDQIRAEKQAQRQESAQLEAERQQAIDSAEAHPESQIAQTQADVAEAERDLAAAERAQILEQRTGHSDAALEQAQAALEEEEALADAVRENYGGLKQRLRKTRITLTDTQRQEAANIAGSYGQYRRSLFGTFNFVAEGGTSLDSLWQELSEQYPELFPAGTNEGDMMARLLEIKSGVFGAEARVKAARARLAEAQKAAAAQNAALEQIDRAAPEETEALLREAVSNDLLSESDAQKIGEKKGVTFEDRGFDGKAGVKLQISPKRKKQLTSIQSAQIRMLDAIGKDFGIEVLIRENTGAESAFIRGTNRLYVDLDAVGDGVIQAGVAESIRYIRQNNPEGYDAMLDFVRTELTDAGLDWDELIDRRKAEAAQQGRALTDSGAVEGIVAESYPQMFTDPVVLHRFADAHRGAFRTIRKFFADFWQKIRDVTRDITHRAAENGTKRDELFALVGDSEALQKMYNLFSEAGSAASEANRQEIEAYAAERAEEHPGGLKRSFAAQTLTGYQQRQLHILDAIGRQYGVEIEIVDSIEGGKANAVYEGGNRIKVALDAADQAYVQVGTHELVHYLRSSDEAGYRTVEKLVTDELRRAEGYDLAEAIRERQAEYAERGVDLDESAAMEEIVAEAIPSIWGDERAVQAFVSQHRSLAQKIRDFIAHFVERLKQYAVDYAVDQDRTEILALQSREQDAAGTLEQIARTFDLALESARGGDGTAYSLRKGNEIDLSNREYAMFREKIAEIKIGKGAQFPRSAKGEYILAIDNKLVYTDGEFVDTHVSRIIELNVGNESLTDLARETIFDFEKDGIDGAELQGIVESIFGEGCIKTYSGQDSRGNGRQNGRGEERNRQKVRKNNHGDLSSTETSREGLNRERFDLSRKEFAQFYDRIAEIKIGKRPQFQNAPDGSYILDIENKLVYTDGDWDNPTIRRVVSFNLTDGTDLAMAKLFFTEQETEGLDYERIQAILSGIFGETCTAVNYGESRGAASGQNGRGEGRNRAEAGGRDRENLPPERGRKYALKNDPPVQSQEKTFTNLFRALNIQYTKGAEGFAARDGRTAYGNETAGTVHATAVQGAAELSAQLARQLNYRLHLDEIPDLMRTLVPNMMARPDMIMATPAEQREMALAEYTRLWLYDRDAAVDLGGEAFTAEFEARLRGRGYLRAMQTAQRELTRYINAPENVRSTSMVDMDAAEQPAQRTARGRWLETRIADKTYAVQRLTDLMVNQLGEDAVDAADDPRTLMLANANKGQNYVDTLVEDCLIDPEGNTIGNASLGDILHRVGKNKETQREFAAYWLSLHKLDRLTAHQRTLNLNLDPDVIAARTRLAEAQEALDRYAGSLGEVPAQTDRLRQAVNEAAAEVTQAISNAREHAMELDSQRRVSIESRAEVEAAIAQYEEEHPDWRGIVDDATAWYDLFMRAWVVDTGMMSRADYETMHEMYPHYIPTYRTLYQNAEAARNGGGTNGATSGIRRAVGSDLDVFNPVVGLVENMQHLVINYKSAEVGRALVNAIRRTTDNGFIAEIVGTPENAVLHKDYYDSPIEQSLANLGRDGIHMTGGNIMTVMDADGQPVSLQINDPLLADVLLHTQPQDLGRAFNAARRVKALITNTATALSLGFSVPNALGDFGTAIMTGSFASNPVTGALKWAASAVEYTLNHAADSLNSNAGTHFRTGRTYDAYKLFASLNSRYNFREHDARRELETKLYGGSVTFAEVRDAFERSPILGVGSALTALPKLLIRNPIEWINDVIENTTRFAEFKYGKHRTDSYAARLEAGRAAREVTTDFSRSGTSPSLAAVKAFIPFFGATIAGVNKSIMLMSRENRGRRGAILAKAGEIAMIGMAAALARNTRWTDDDREFYDLLQDDYKMKYYILPLDGNGHFLRIKKSQDMIYLLADQMGEFLANYMTGADGGELSDLAGGLKTLLASMTDITTIADPILNVKTNTTWYGTPIENYAMQQKPTGDRYNADTSPLWRGLSNAVQALGMDVSPLDVEYLARQYLGSYGTLLGKTMREATAGTLTAQRFGSLVWDRLFGRLSIDGAVSNQASNIFYEGYDVIAQIARTDTPDGTSSLLKYDLSEGEMQDAIADAKLLLKDLNRVKKDINALWDEYSDTEDEDARREIRKEIMRVCVEANASISDYRAAYCYASAGEQAVLNTLDLFTHRKAKIEE